MGAGLGIRVEDGEGVILVIIMYTYLCVGEKYMHSAFRIDVWCTVRKHLVAT